MCNYFRGTNFCWHKFNVGTNFREKDLFKLFEQSVHYARDLFTMSKFLESFIVNSRNY